MKLLALTALSILVLTMTVSAASIYEIPVKSLEGKDTTLKPYEGKVLLVVNVASQCGYTPQYAGLESIYQKYQGQGLVVLGVPCNQFGDQEPGTNEEIKAFCTSKYNVTFPMLNKLEVNGPDRHPLYVMLAGSGSPFPGDIKWNFNKFLISRDGKILQRFDSKVTPESSEMTGAIEAALVAP